MRPSVTFDLHFLHVSFQDGGGCSGRNAGPFGLTKCSRRGRKNISFIRFTSYERNTFNILQITSRYVSFLCSLSPNYIKLTTSWYDHIAERSISITNILVTHFSSIKWHSIIKILVSKCSKNVYQVSWQLLNISFTFASFELLTKRHNFSSHSKTRTSPVRNFAKRTLVLLKTCLLTDVNIKYY